MSRKLACVLTVFVAAIAPFSPALSKQETRTNTTVQNSVENGTERRFDTRWYLKGFDDALDTIDRLIEAGRVTAARDEVSVLVETAARTFGAVSHEHATVLNRWGHIHALAADYRHALLAYGEADEIIKGRPPVTSSGTPSRSGRAANTATQSNREATQDRADGGRVVDVLKMLNRLAASHAAAGFNAQALKNLTFALALINKSEIAQASDIAAGIMEQIGRSFSALGRPEMAILFMKQSQKIERRIQSAMPAHVAPVDAADNAIRSASREQRIKRKSRILGFRQSAAQPLEGPALLPKKRPASKGGIKISAVNNDPPKTSPAKRRTTPFAKHQSAIPLPGRKPAQRYAGRYPTRPSAKTKGTRASKAPHMRRKAVRRVAKVRGWRGRSRKRVRRDPYAYRYEPRGYYPYRVARQWRPAHLVRRHGLHR